jgi:hypothetical protein
MTQKQEEHLEGIVEEFKAMIGWKYPKGVKEHGGNLWELSALELVEHALEEAVDQVAYLVSLRSVLVKRDQVPDQGV